MFLSVASSKLATQPVGETAWVADGVFQLKLPVPFPLRFVSAYLIRGNDGWTIVDAGYDYPPAREAWETGAAGVGCGLGGEVVRIVVTHFHPDHLGAARWLQERTGAPVYMLDEEIRHSREFWGGGANTEPFVEELVRNGLERDLAEKAAAGTRSSLTLPEDLRPLRAGEKLEVGDGAARVVHAPGHAEYQVMLHDERRRVLYAADHVLLKITPNIGLWPESKLRPLSRYLESLKSIRNLDADLVLPGHGPVFHDLGGRIDELLSHHAERLDLMLSVITSGQKTPFEVSRQVFRGDLSLYEQCFALTETLAHLEHLEVEGRAERVEDGLVYYRMSA